MTARELRPLVSKVVEALDPAEYPPPLGCKLILITKGNICTVGEWNDDCAFWHPLIRRPRKKEQK